MPADILRISSGSQHVEIASVVETETTEPRQRGVFLKTSLAPKPVSNFHRRLLSRTRNTPSIMAFAVHQDHRGDGGLNPRSPARRPTRRFQDLPFTNGPCSVPALCPREPNRGRERRVMIRRVISAALLREPGERCSREAVLAKSRDSWPL